jgi:hypothetical protein
VPELPDDPLVPLVPDDTRGGKTLSVTRQFITWGRSFFTRNQYLNSIGDFASNNSGYRMIRNATITGISVQTEDSDTYTVRIRKNGSATNIASLSVSSATGNEDGSVNIDVNEGDRLHCYLESTNFVQYPVVILEIAWRL